MASLDTTRTRNILLLGRTGRGKSATGNTILGTDVFLSKRGATSVTMTCELHSVVRPDGMTINVVDTPGLFDPGLSNGAVVSEISKSLSLMPGATFHAALIVLNGDDVRFTAEEQCAMRLLRLLFGPKLFEVATFVFTRGDYFAGEGGREKFDEEVIAPLLLQGAVEGDVENLGGDAVLGGGARALREWLVACGGRWELLNNIQKGGSSQTESLFSTIEGNLERLRVSNAQEVQSASPSPRTEVAGPSSTSSSSSVEGSSAPTGSAAAAEKTPPPPHVGRDPLLLEEERRQQHEEHQKESRLGGCGYGVEDFEAHAATLSEAQRKALNEPLSPEKQQLQAKALAGQVGGLKSEVQSLKELVGKMTKEQSTTVMAIVSAMQQQMGLQAKAGQSSSSSQPPSLPPPSVDAPLQDESPQSAPGSL